MVAALLPGFFILEGVFGATVEEIVTRSEQVYPGLDQRSKLTFLIKEAGGFERKIVLRRFWKNYNGENGIASKMMIFYEYPPEEKGQSFMTWSYTGRADDRWIYLPLLRQVQKVPEKMTGGFQAIDFRPEDMAPRPVDLDRHRLVKEEVIDNKPYYVIETVPKSQEQDQIYGKWIKWISKDQYLKEKIDYYDRNNKLWKEQFISWKKLGPSWVWEKVMIKNLQTNVQTSLIITEVQVDSDLPDKFFTERTMKLGLEGIR
jgi:hypothetical protein